MGCTDNVGSDVKRCTQTADEGYNKCTQTEDEGYNECSQSEDQGYKDCCDWWPCSWACDAWVWVSNIVCVAWTWISKIVCVAWTWFSKIVCVAWTYVVAGLCAAWDVVVSVVNAVVTTIEGVVSVLLNAAAWLVLFVFQIPIVGRFINWLWNVGLSIAYGVASAVDVVAGLLGILPEKRLRLLVINQQDENGQPIAAEGDLLAAIGLAIKVYREQANIRVLPVKLFQYRTSFSGDEQASDDYISNVTSKGGVSTLDVDCGASDLTTDLGAAGADFQDIMMANGFWTSFRRLTGYGAPICAFAVRKITVDPGGCSLGPLTDYVVVNFTNASRPDMPPSFNKSSILAHEMGHCCYLFHVSAPNLMASSVPRAINLDGWQVALIRASRHVTYF